jgi:hypothetical protein
MTGVAEFVDRGIDLGSNDLTAFHPEGLHEQIAVLVHGFSFRIFSRRRLQPRATVA